jgi:hypothetical protein
MISKGVLRERRYRFHFRLSLWFPVIPAIWICWDRGLISKKKISRNCHSVLPLAKNFSPGSKLPFSDSKGRTIESLDWVWNESKEIQKVGRPMRDNSVPVDPPSSQILNSLMIGLLRIESTWLWKGFFSPSMNSHGSKVDRGHF